MPKLWTTGVYVIRNLVDGKVYVGMAARSFEKRWKEHRTSLSLGKHCNKYLQRAWDKYGPEAFVFRILEGCRPEDCYAREADWIKKLDATNKLAGYNSCNQGRSQLGVEKPPSYYLKMVGRKASPETRAKMSAAHLGKKVPSRGRKGLKRSEETRARMSAARKLRITKQETRDKLSIVARNRKFSAETRAKLAEAHLGLKHSEETKAKISRASILRRMQRVG